MDKTIKDIFKRDVRLTENRMNHLLEDHPEMKNSETLIVETLQKPEEVRFSNADKTVELFYKFYEKSVVGAKFLCVVVKNLIEDFFVITAYYTDKKKKGESKWVQTKK